MPVPDPFKFKPSVPSPVTPLTVTVYTLPLTGVTVMPVSAVPPVIAVKSLASTPVTDSEKVTVNDSLLPLFGVVPVRLIELTEGAVCSMVYTSPPVNAAEAPLPTASVIPASPDFKSRRSVPSPVTPPMVTVYVVPLPVIEEMPVVATVPPVVRAKSAATTPDTDSENTTWY